MRRWLWVTVTAGGLLTLGACGRAERLDTRTYTLEYLAPHQAESIVKPYVFTDRTGAPGEMSVTSGALTVRETADNLNKIGRVLAQYDQPRPSVTLRFQVVEADGQSPPDSAIADVERELRRVFRYQGYQLVAETQVSGIERSSIQQTLAGTTTEGAGRTRIFQIVGNIEEIQGGPDDATVTLGVSLRMSQGGLPLLDTTVTIPTGQAVVLGTTQVPGFPGALILVVRAEVQSAAGAASTPATAAAPSS